MEVAKRASQIARMEGATGGVQKNWTRITLGTEDSFTVRTEDAKDFFIGQWVDVIFSTRERPL